MKPYFKAERVALYLGDCVKVMASFPNACVDAIVTDPPYGLEFMGKEWDKLGAGTLTDPAEAKGFQDGNGGNAFSRSRVRFGTSAKSMQAWHEAWAREALRILKPGGHLLAFGGTRTYHRMACAIEDAGFEIRDSLMWLYGSGFPKSLDVSKAIDRMNGDKRTVSGSRHVSRKLTGGSYGKGDKSQGINVPITSAASAAWEGWGTALKPAYEPIVMARKPLVGTVAANVAAYGTGGLNIDGCRIEGGDLDASRMQRQNSESAMMGGLGASGSNPIHEQPTYNTSGRWPANVLLDEAAAAMLDAQSDSAGASRFFYTAKTSRAEREFALGDLDNSRRSDGREKDIENPRLRTSQRRNDHPTVKPIDVMRWLCRLVTPPNGVVLDPFLGSGSTGAAAFQEGSRFIGIDLDEHYLEIAKRRIRRRAKPADMARDIKASKHLDSLADRGYGSLLDNALW